MALNLFGVTVHDAHMTQIEVAVLNQSRDPIAALRFARFVAAPDRGLRHFREAGFRVEGDADGEGAKP